MVFTYAKIKQRYLGKCSTNLEAHQLFIKLTDTEGVYQLSTYNVMLHPENDGLTELYGLQLLGSPIGTDEFITQYLTAKITTIEEQSKQLIELENNQIKFLLLTQCFNTKINHLLRTISPSLTIPHLLQPFNKILRNIVSSITGVDIYENQWLQSNLRINQGGLGIGVSEHTAHSAYVASFLSTFSDIQQILPNLREIISNPLETTCTISIINNYVTSIRIINYKNTYNEVTALSLIPIQSTTTINTPNKLQSLFASSNHQQQYTNYIENIKHDILLGSFP